MPALLMVKVALGKPDQADECPLLQATFYAQKLKGNRTKCAGCQRDHVGFCLAGIIRPL